MNTATQTKYRNYINGAFQDTGSDKTLTVYHKFNGSVIAEVPYATEAQMEAAIQGSVKGFHSLASWSAGSRSDLLARIREGLLARREEFVDMIIAEAGKPRSYAETEIDRCAVTLLTAVEEAKRFDGEMINIDFLNGQGKTAFTRRFPIGPIAAISPFNFPLNLALHKIAPAIAAGCSLVLKPSPQSPLVTLMFAEVCHEAGMPEGGLNVLVADIPEAEKMVRDERMKMLSFTGSPQIGWHLKNIVGKKKVALELGGNAAVLVDDTAKDIHRIAKLTAFGSFLYAGQICISTQRIFVHEGIWDTFLPELIEATKATPAGDPNDAANTVGPIIDNGHLKRIASWVQEAVDAGAQVLAGGEILNNDQNLYAPTLLTNTSKGMKVNDEEIFGPVAIVEKVKDFKEGINRINDSKFGLQAGVFTNSLDHMKHAFEHLEVGGVMMNNIPGFRIDNMPYGGVKDSGYGREGIRYAMEEMTEPRLLVF